MKLIIQIPCFNEEGTLPQTIEDLPKKIPGIDVIEILIMDDGSSDRTVEIAEALGVHHIVRHKKNRGLAAAFRTALDASLSNGADIIVNTDGDNQYNGEDIALLVQPILDGEADIVIGDRQTRSIAHFSPFKKTLQNVGSGIVRFLSRVDVPDAVSGFRALSRDAARKINILTRFSYTIEMIIQAGYRGLKVTCVPVRVNAATRESRLARSILQFVWLSGVTTFRTMAMYRPIFYFFLIAIFFLLVGSTIFGRFLYYYLIGNGEGKIQSLIFGGVCILISVHSFMLGILAELIGFNRQLQETSLEKIRHLEAKIDRLEAGKTRTPEKPRAERKKTFAP